MEEKYREFLIKYDEFGEKFIAYSGEDVESSSTNLTELKKRLDKIIDGKKTFKPVPVLSVEGAIVVFGKITSVAENGMPRVTWEGGKRENWWSNRKPYLDTPENIAIAEEYKKVYMVMKATQKQLQEIETKLKQYEVPFGKCGMQ